MNAKDLMIGDFIKDLDGNYLVVSAIDTTLVEYGLAFVPYRINCPVYWCRRFDYEQLQPIPLTPKIFEKNGYVHNSDWYYAQQGYPDITAEFSEDAYEVGKARYYGKGEPEFQSIISIRYVHELQHVLKLCGIEKEVIL